MAIKADATLVQAAATEAQSGAMADVPNMKPLYESTAEIGKTAMDTMTGIMDQIKVEKELEAAAKEKRLEPLNTAAKAVYDAIYNGKESLPNMFVDAFQNRIEELQDEFEKVNTEGEGDTKANARKRREITGELARLKNEAINVRTNFMISTQDPDQWNTALIEDDLEGSLLSIFDLWKDPNKTPEGISAKIVNGKLEITTPGYSTEERLKEGFVRPTTREEYAAAVSQEGNTMGLYDDIMKKGKTQSDEDFKKEVDNWVAMRTEKYQKPTSRTFNSDDISKALNQKNKANDSFILKGINDVTALGATNGGAESAKEKNTYYNDITKEQDIADITAYLSQNPGAFRDMVVRGMEGVSGDVGMKTALLSSGILTTDIIKSMYKTTNIEELGGWSQYSDEEFHRLNAFVSKLDTNTDGNIDNSDAEGLEGNDLKAFKKNWDIVLETITNPDSDHFNEKKSHRILAEYYTNFKEQAYNNSYNAAYKQKNPTAVTNALTVDQKRYYDVVAGQETRALNLSKENRIRQEKQQTQTDEQNTVYSIENEFSAGETTIGKGSRYAQKSEETTVENDDGTTTTIPAGWTLFVDGKVEKTIKTDDPDILDEITKHVTDTAGKYKTYETGKSIKNGHLYVGGGNWAPQGSLKEFPLKLVKVEDAEDGKYYKGNNGKTYYFTKKDGYKEI